MLLTYNDKKINIHIPKGKNKVIERRNWIKARLKHSRETLSLAAPSPVSMAQVWDVS